MSATAAPTRRGGSGPGFINFLLVAVLLAGGSFASACYRFQEPPAQVWQRLGNAVASWRTPAATPTSEPPPTPAVVAEEEPEPESPPPETVHAPAATPAPTPERDALAWLSERKQRWPQEVRLVEATSFPIVYNGKEAGAGAVPAGSAVRLVNIEPAAQRVMVAYAGYGNTTRSLPLRVTNLLPLARAAMQQADHEPPPPDAPVAAAPTPGASVPPPTVEMTPADSPASPPAYVPAGQPTRLLDDLRPGDEASGQRHAFSAQQSETFRGALGESARRLLTGGDVAWEGGKLAFTLKVDPKDPTYLTVRLWGSDLDHNSLILFCEGKQVGYRHLGDIDLLGMGDEGPRYNGRFYYVTTPLPVEMTRGKSALHFEVRSLGPTWGYAPTFEKYQKPMTEPTRGIYRLYTHTDPCFTPPTDEKQGEAPANPPRRPAPGPEVLDAVKERVNHTAQGLLTKKVLNQMEIHFLASAYGTRWTKAFHDARTLQAVADGLDGVHAAWKRDPKLLEEDKSTPNPGWFGFGPAADAVRLLGEPLGPLLDKPLPDGRGGTVPRREAWAEMFQASREWLRRHRRLYTNQSMIVDMNLYRSNRGLAAIAPARATPEEQMLRYLYESIGLQPWLGSDTDHGPEKGMGDDYRQITDKGLTKELGYVGNYGEVLDWVTQIYHSTQPAPGQPGDQKIKAQLAKMERARGVFRYPMLDDEGNRAMRMETVVGWRDTHFPGDVTYGGRPSWDGAAFFAAAATLDPSSVGYAQQMLADNQFFASVARQLEGGNLRVTSGLMAAPDDYELIRAQPATPLRLPMSWDQPDFVFSDEEDGVVAVKHAGEILYASLYWRARYAVNSLARVHRILPAYQGVAVAREEVKFEASGMTYRRPDWINFGFGNGGPRYPGELHSAHAGEELPIAKIPPGIEFHVGQENPHAGRGEFYSLRYGPYLIGMNTTRQKDFQLAAPANVMTARELVSGKLIPLSGGVKVGPRSTVVLYLEPAK